MRIVPPQSQSFPHRYSDSYVLALLYGQLDVNQVRIKGLSILDITAIGLSAVKGLRHERRRIKSQNHIAAGRARTSFSQHQLAFGEDVERVQVDTWGVTPTSCDSRHTCELRPQTHLASSASELDHLSELSPPSVCSRGQALHANIGRRSAGQQSAESL